MRLSLDTSAYSSIGRNHAQIIAMLEEADELVLSSIVVGELLYGYVKGRRERENRTELRRFVRENRVEIGVIDEMTANRFADIADHLRRQGTPLPTNDIWIAAHAMQHGLQVVTLDRYFMKMPQVSTLLFEP